MLTRLSETALLVVGVWILACVLVVVGVLF
jgi:hypothetical protein